MYNIFHFGCIYAPKIRKRGIYKRVSGKFKKQTTMKIYILESLRQTDPKTGKLVHDYLDSKAIKNQFYEFKTKQELLDILKIVTVDSASENIQPFVHFDCHGNENGIGVVKADASEELITWNEIQQAFREIYMSSKQKSVICMSSCQGFNVIKLVSRCQPCPYDHVCGSFEKISFADSYKGYTKFYDLILNGASIYDAALNVHNDPNFIKLKFIGLNSDTLFRLSVEGYLKNECTEEKLREKKELHRKIVEVHGPLNQIQLDYLEKAFSLEGQKQILERCAETFFSLK